VGRECQRRARDGRLRRRHAHGLAARGGRASARECRLLYHASEFPDISCLRLLLEAASLLVERGASLTELNGDGGTALGAAIHGSVSCHDPEGGATMRLPEEVRHGDHAGVVEVLIAAGSPLPARIRGRDAVAGLRRRHGVPEDGSSTRPGRGAAGPPPRSA
jgi:hypothetical protein